MAQNKWPYCATVIRRQFSAYHSLIVKRKEGDYPEWIRLQWNSLDKDKKQAEKKKKKKEKKEGYARELAKLLISWVKTDLGPQNNFSGHFGGKYYHRIQIYLYKYTVICIITS